MTPLTGLQKPQNAKLKTLGRGDICRHFLSYYKIVCKYMTYCLQITHLAVILNSFQHFGISARLRSPDPVLDQAEVGELRGAEPEEAGEHPLQLALLNLRSRQQELDRQRGKQVSRVLEHLRTNQSINIRSILNQS